MMRYLIIKVTPLLAEKYLEILTKNRVLRTGHVAHICKIMLSGEWKIMGEPMRFHGKLGAKNLPMKGAELLDGQHRLKAFLLSEKKTLNMEVMDGVPKESFKYMDQGRPRSAPDVLSIAGYKNANVLAGVGRALYLFKKGGIKEYWLNSRGGIRKVSNNEVLEYVTENDKTIHLAIREATRHMAKISMSLSCHGAAYYLFKKKSLQDCEKFFYLLGTGEKLTKTNPVYYLRSILIDHRISRKRAKTMNIHTRDLMIIMILAWNAFRENKRMFNRNELLEFDNDNLPKSIK